MKIDNQIYMRNLEISSRSRVTVEILNYAVTSIQHFFPYLYIVCYATYVYIYITHTHNARARARKMHLYIYIYICIYNSLHRRVAFMTRLRDNCNSHSHNVQPHYRHSISQLISIRFHPSLKVHTLTQQHKPPYEQ